MTPNPHFSLVDDNGIVWIEFVACKHCHHLICNSLSALQLGHRKVQCNGCGQIVQLFDETYFQWTDEPPEPQITNVRTK